MRFAEEVQTEQERLSELASFVAPHKRPSAGQTGEGFQTAIGDFSSLKFATAVPFYSWKWSLD
jgi:hypothetical protein